MAYSLTLSHVGIYVKDMNRMVDFYSGFLGFAVSDRGPARGGGEILFMTRDPRQHHQLVLANGRPEHLDFNLVNQPDNEFWAALEAKARTMPGFKPLGVWEAEIKERIAQATRKRRSALAHPA